jgi:putative hydrolase of the HAD superfamily
MPTKNIILDFGGVLINLDIPKTIAEFNKFSDTPFEHIYTQAAQTELFSALDKGQISEQVFFSKLAEVINYKGPQQNLLHAWNAMLLDLPKHRLDLVLHLKTKYRTFLLSNTCEPHITVFERDMKQVHGIDNLNGYFEKVYYSCRMGMRKPDKEIFECVLRENNLNPDETIFIDDSIQHVKGAAAAGIQAHLLEKGRELNDLLIELKLL